MPDPIYILNGDPKYFSIEYIDNGDPQKKADLEDGWRRFNRSDPASNQTYQIWYRRTNRNMEVNVDHFMPPGSPTGRYRVETYVPGRHATTRRAIFTVANNFHLVGSEVQHDDTLSVVDMYDLFDVWHSLGEFDLDPGSNPLSGRVRQFDLSTEDPPAEAAFGPVRWVPLFTQPSDPTKPASGSSRFDSPVGTQTERDGIFSSGAFVFNKYPVWNGAWFDFNPYLSWYSLGYHTGADLNLPGSSDADKGKPIYCVADGTVIYAGPAGSWGNIVVIEHPDALVSLPDGTSQRQVVYTRYGHVEDRILVKKGQAVSRGENIASIGLPAGQVTGWHLHFDVCYSGLLKSRPAHWPDMTKIRLLQKNKVSPNSPQFRNAQSIVKREVVSHYIDPLKFIKDNHG